MREYDLLVGILACQLRLVSRGSLVRFSAALTQSPGLPLLDYLVESKAITEADQQLLCRLTDTIIHAHHGDERAALKAFGGDDAASEAFAHSVVQTDQGWGPSEEQTVLADRLPHGLPAQIIPETIGRYTRGSEYARGGIGRILLVHDEQIGRDIILKELLPEHATSPTDSTLSRIPHPESPKSPMRQSAAMMARFLQEAKITGQLEHPSIVPVYELGTRSDGQLYYTMKLVRGDTLAVAIKNATNPRDRLALLRNFLDVCQAMAYAHAKGVIHRDLKPSNIMVGEFGECVVLDWGLAKLQKDQDAHLEAMQKTISQFRLGDDQLTNLQTKSKDVLGTPLYMAPEQARGEIDGISLHSDVYGLGVILYEILSGELPHAWSNSMDTIRRVGSIPAPSIKKAAPQTPPELAAICDKALAFHAKQRYTSARELSNDIQKFLEGAVVDAYAYRVTDILRRLYQKHKPMILTTCAAAMVLLAMGAISYFKIYQARKDAEIARDVAVSEREKAEMERSAAQSARLEAEAAQERTAQEKYISDIRLADAFVRDYKIQAAEVTLLATDPQYRNFEWSYLIAMCNQDLATLAGHTNVVFKSFFSPDGTQIATVGGDHTARLWNAENFEQIHEWRFPNVWVRYAVFDITGTRLALCLTDGTVRIIDPLSGSEIFALSGHTAPVNYCAFNISGEKLLTASSDRTAILWDLGTHTPVNSVEDQGSEIKATGFCDSDNKIYTVTDKGLIRLYSLEGKRVAEAHGIGVNAPGDGTVLTARGGNEAIVYRGSDLTEVLRLPHEDLVERVTYYPELQQVATACADGIARVWQLPEGTIQQVFNVRNPLKDCRISPDGRLLGAMATNGLLVVWDRESAREIVRFSGHRAATASMEFQHDGARILTCSMDGTARLWQTDHSSMSRLVARTEPGLTHMSYENESEQIVVTSRAGQVEVLNLASGASIYKATFPEQLGGTKAALAPDGHSLVIISDDFLPLLIALPEGKILRRLEGHDGYITSVNYSPDKRAIATASWDDSARLWDATTGDSLGVLVGHTDTVNYTAFSDGGEYIATASHDKTAIVWDRSSLAAILTIQHKSPVKYCAFSHDGALVTTASDDGTVQIWRIPTKELLYTLAGQMYDVSSVSFSPNDDRLLSVSSDNSVRLWDVGSGQALLVIPMGNDRVVNAAFGPSPDKLLIATESGEVREITGLSLESARRVVDFIDLGEQVQEFKAARLQSATRTSIAQASERIDRIVPQPQASTGLGALIGLASASPSDQGLRIDRATEEHCWPMGLHEGDEILNINGKAVLDFSTFATSLPSIELDPNGVQFYVDLVRDRMSLRLKVTILPVSSHSRVVTLQHAQAKSLIDEAVKTLRANTEAILQVNKRWAAYAHVPLTEPDALPGLWVNAPTELLGKRMLKVAGLRAAERLLSVGGKPVVSLSSLLEESMHGLNYMNSNAEFQLELNAARGSFANVVITVKNEN